MATYAESFATFLAATDEKLVLGDALVAAIRRFNVRSVCDVGAGPGELAQRLAACVDDYMAVEASPEYATALRHAGLSVLERHWPTPLGHRFDAVVLSHVLDPRQDVIAMISSAIDALTRGGVLLAVVHAVEGSEWERFLTCLGLRELVEADLRDVVETTLSNRGMKIHTDILRTSVVTTTEDALVDALSFVVSSESPDAVSRFASRSNDAGLCLQAYEVANGYEFPFEHALMVGGPREG